MRRKAMVAALAVTTFFGVAACGGSSGGGSGSSGGGDANADLTDRGPITYVQGKDNSNVVRPLIDKWNAAHPNEKVTFKEQTDQADQQHDDLVQHFQAKDPNYDVVDVDVVWTAEFAAKGWLQPLKDKMAHRHLGDAAGRRSRPPPTTARCTRPRRPPTAASCTTARTWSPPRRRRGTR